MPKIQRKTQKIFCNSADSDQIAVFGSMSTGNPVYSNDVEQLQSNEAYEIGWDAATLEDKAPFMEEMNGMQYGITKQLAYNFQEGIPEYDAGTTYYVGSICKVLEEGKPVLYTSLTDENLGNNPITDATNWERLSFGGGLEIGDIGIAPLGIDETKGKRRYLNGQIVIQDQYVQFTNKLKSAIASYPSLACTEQEWQTTATMTVGGQVGKFVVDNDAGTIRLPKIIMPIQGLANLANLGEIVEAGLPSIEHTHKIMLMVNTGASNFAPSHYDSATYSGDYTTTINSEVSSIYGNSDTVQQEQIQYPYFIQVATGAEIEDNIINEIELNNPYSLLDVKWSDKLLNNVSWLRSNGQSNSSADYVSAYNLILTEYNSGTDETETVGGTTITFRRGATTGIKVTIDKASFDSILSATGTAWYYVLDIANSAFYLPQSDGFLQFGGDGNFVEAGLPNITGTVVGGGNDGAGASSTTGAFKYIGTTISKTYGASGSEYTSEVADFDASRSSSIYGNSDTVQPNAVKGYLYFYVGETVQNANLINAGRIEEKLSDYVNRNDMAEVPCIVETYINGTSWYRIWSDKWCEQGGRATCGSSATAVTLLKPYKDINYSAITTLRDISSAGYQPCVYSRTTTTFSCYYLNSGGQVPFDWQTSGYIA